MTFIRRSIEAARQHPRTVLSVTTAVLAVGAMIWPNLPVDKLTSLVAMLLGL